MTHENLFYLIIRIKMCLV